MNYKIIIIIILFIILIILHIKNNKNIKNKETEYFNLTEVLQNMASVYEESDGTLSFQNLKATGDTFLKRVIINDSFTIRNGVTNSGGGIINSGPGGISNTGGNLTNRGKFINTGTARITESLEVLGDISGNLVGLKGMIVMWSGPITTIPEGWKLCDGLNGTPDLRSRFVVGAALKNSTLASGLTVKEFTPEGTKGGLEKVQLSIDEMPSHTHTYRADGSALVGLSHEWERNGGSHQNGQTTHTGGSQPHENMPPYYALAYIMKV